MDYTEKKLGIIAGKGLLPSEIAKLYLKQGGQVCIAAIDKETDISLIAKHPYKHFSLGSVGSLFEYFTENQVKDVIMIGGINRPDLKSLKVDVIGSVLIAKILKEKFLGDDNVLRVVADFIESKGFKVISPQDLLKIDIYENLYVTKTIPTKQDKSDIEIGMKVLKQLGSLDVGQSVIVYDSYILGVEAAEGTDNLIRRCELLRKDNKGGVLVKMSKLGQDTRLDVPTIGPDTIFYLAKHGYNGLAIEKSGVIIVKPEETIELLNKNKLFIKYL